jgi:uncharacterized protein (DUF433 family)
MHPETNWPAAKRSLVRITLTMKLVIGYTLSRCWHPARRQAGNRCTISHMVMLETIVQVDPEILGGTPVFRGTRVPVKNLLDYLAAGDTLDRFLDDFPTVKREQAVAALELARDLLTAGAHPAR